MKTLPQRFVKVKMAHRYICQGNPLRRPYKVVNVKDLGGFTWTGADNADETKLNELLTCLSTLGYGIKTTFHTYPSTRYQVQFCAINYDIIQDTSGFGPDLASAVFAATDRLVNKMAEWKARDAE